MAFTNSGEILQRVVKYSEDYAGASIRNVDANQHSSGVSEHELEALIKQYETRIQERNDQIENLKAGLDVQDLSVISVPSNNVHHRLQQLQAMSTAYDGLTRSTPGLTDPKSQIPLLFALQDATASINEARSALDTSINTLQSLEHQLRSEQAHISDADALSSAMNSRIVRLQAAQEERISKPADELARDVLKAKQSRLKYFTSERSRLRVALEDFIDSQLAAMIAAEELGGPPVGELEDVDEKMLQAGFSSQGKPINSTSSSANSENKRQQRLDTIWGLESATPDSERAAASNELQKLIDDLIKAQSDSSETGVYVDLRRDSAAARFLVRAKVAQYHSKDARKLRLIDFGRDIDD